MNDKRGEALSIGDTVAFSVLSYGSAKLRIGTVSRLEAVNMVGIQYDLGGIRAGVTKRCRDVVKVVG